MSLGEKAARAAYSAKLAHEIRKLRTWATVKQIEREALSAAAMDLPSFRLPDDRDVGFGLVPDIPPFPPEHARLRAMLLSLMGGSAGGPAS
jgi:hypothetical protein